MDKGKRKLHGFEFEVKKANRPSSRRPAGSYIIQSVGNLQMESESTWSVKTARPVTCLKGKELEEGKDRCSLGRTQTGQA